MSLFHVRCRPFWEGVQLLLGPPNIHDTQSHLQGKPAATISTVSLPVCRASTHIHAAHLSHCTPVPLLGHGLSDRQLTTDPFTAVRTCWFFVFLGFLAMAHSL